MYKRVDLIVVIKRDDEVTGFLGVNEYLGISYIKTYLKEKGVKTKIHVVFNSDIEKIANIFEEKPEIVGLCLYSDIVNEVMITAKKLKDCYPDIHIAIGGPQVTNFSEKIMEDNEFLDSIIVGEGEITFYELVERLTNGEGLEGCMGMTYRDEKGKILKNKARPPILDLDKLPFPDRDIFMMERKEYFYIAGSRGCLGVCSFCGEPMLRKDMKPYYVRNRSPKNIVDEMEYLMKKYDLDSFRFTDATFEDPDEEGRKKAEGVFDEIIRRDLKVSIHIFTRAELVTEDSREYLRKAFKAGLECAYVGVESASQQDLKLYNKIATKEDNCRALKIIREEGIHPNFGFICFNPYSTHETLLENADFLYKSGLGHVFYLFQTRLEVLAQSPIRYKMIEDGLLKSDADYTTHFYDYSFLNHKIKEIYNIIKNATKKTPIYYMDTILGTHRVWVNKYVDEDKRPVFENLFAKVDEIRRRKAEENYEFFKTCVLMSKEGKSKKEIEEYSQNQDLDTYFDEFMNLYFKINVKVTKHRFKLFNM